MYICKRINKALYDMKRFNISILFAVLLLCVSAVKGQSVVSDVLNHSSDTTIVRYWKNGISIVYTHNEDDENWFLLVDTVMPHAMRIVVPPDVTVNDFRIFHDTLFLGGNHVDVIGTKRGLLACFAINDFYSGAGYYHWGLAMATPMPDIFVFPYVHDQICDILRLAVYDSSGYSKIAFIARNLIEGDSWQRVGVGCARYDGTLWNGMFLYNKYGREEYTDIISTENYVVAVARTNDSTCLALRVYPKSNFIYPAGFYPSDVFYPNKYGQGLCDLQVDGNVMATALNGDEFALAYHYTNSPKDGLAVRMFSILGGTASLTQGVNVPTVRQPGSTWKMRDVRCSPAFNYLLVLNDFDGGTLGSLASIVYQFQLPTLATGFYYGRYLSGYIFHALDSYLSESEEFIVSGYKSGMNFLTLYWEPLGISVSCGAQDMIHVDRTTPSLNTTFMQTNMNMPNFQFGRESFEVEEIERRIICN